MNTAKDETSLSGKIYNGALALMVFLTVTLMVVGVPVLFSLAVSNGQVNDSMTRADEPALAPGQAGPTTAEQASQWLRNWADALPESSGNHGRRTGIAVAVDPENPQLWSVRTTLGHNAIPVFGWIGIGWPKLDMTPSIDSFVCTVITSANPRPVVYPTAGGGGLFRDNKHCDGSSPRVRAVDPRYGTASLDADWSRLADALGTEAGRANLYLTANRFGTDLARYAVVESQAVSGTETRLVIRQSATGAGQLPCAALDVENCDDDPEPRVQTRTVIVSTDQTGTGPVTVGNPQS